MPTRVPVSETFGTETSADNNCAEGKQSVKMTVFVLKLRTFFAIFVMYGPKQGVQSGCCPGDKAASNTPTVLSETGGKAACNQTSNLIKQKDWLMDLNITVFISNVLFATTAENDDSALVDIGTTSCEVFDNEACYITCSNRTVDRRSACYVTINVTCNVDNVKGRYVRIRKSNTTEEFALCHAIVEGWPSASRGLKNYALNASANQSTTDHFSYPSLAVDGDWGNLSRSVNFSSCSQTALLDQNTRTVHWWQVNLTKPLLVSNIIIVNHWDKCCNQRLANFTVELGRLESNGNITYTLCRYFDGVAGHVTNLTCTRSIWGQFVRISKTGDALILCEVEVYGDTDNTTETLPELISEFNCNNPKPSDQNTTSFNKSQAVVLTQDWGTTSNVSTEVQDWDASTEWSVKLEQSTSEMSARTRDWGKMSTGNLDWTTSHVSTGNKDQTTSHVSTGNQDWTTSHVSTGNKDQTTSHVSTGNKDQTTSHVSTGNKDQTTSHVSTGNKDQTTSHVSTVKRDGTTSWEMSIEDSSSLSPHKHMVTYSMTHDVRVKKPYCACRCDESASKLNTTDVEVKITQTTRELLVQSSFLGKQTRKKSSASDDRLSSVTLGVTGLACLLLAFGLVISCDLYRVCSFFFTTRAKWVERRMLKE